MGGSHELRATSSSRHRNLRSDLLFHLRLRPDGGLVKISRYRATRYRATVVGGDVLMAPTETGKWVLYDVLEAHLRAMRAEWEKEQLEAMLSDKAVDAAESEIVHAMKSGPVEPRFYIIEALQAAWGATK